MSEGELMIDHRNSPGIPAEMALLLGFRPQDLGAGRMFEAAILTCVHCAVPQIKNPERVRMRAHCRYCNAYICDFCSKAAENPEYVHRSFQQIADMVMSGGFTVSGSTSAPILTPTKPE